MKRLLATLVLLFPLSAVATPIVWTGNGHGYEIFQANVDWTTAKALAESKGGHLATITSQAENDFLFNTFSLSGVAYWLGGIQTGGPEPAGGWEWVTGEAWGYTNWAFGEPNNGGGIEDSLALAFFQYGTWNDAPTNYLYGTAGGYIVEYSSVPAPAALIIFGLGLLLLGAARRCRAA